ncbi:LysM peptidoglycan-binding domain-containing protein [Anaerocolumna sp.]|uniref:LysM peptidoglycan-binding domain-containing protein n=1 Tax=Anaerocolumna sp. TaxID=2041569 RepID=UPI0028A7F296|nr:LysM domain-containing protein [Anaerocolumna sp.]
MDNGHNNTHNGKKPDDTMNNGIYKLPKNIRQIGNIPTHNKIIYVEDYVMTFMKQIGQREPANCSITVLLGYFVRTEERKHIFIKGAVEMKQNDFYNGITFTDECWTSIYENIKKYFSDIEIVGWALVGSGFYLDNEEMIRKTHMENFNGPDKTLLKIDTLEKEEVFYLFENNQLVKQSGYYIYYEKNEEMQNYMIDAKNVVGEERDYQDHTTQKIRHMIQEKNEQKQLKTDDKNIVRLLYAASTLLAVIVLVIAGTMLNNYKKMRDMEEALYAISENLNQNKNENAKGKDSNDIQEVSNFNKETVEEAKGNKEETANGGEATKENTGKETVDVKGTDPQSDTVEVETISGGVAANNEEQKEEKNIEEESKGNDLENPKEEKKEQGKKEPTPKPTAEPTKEPTPEPTKEPEKEKPKEVKETAKEIRYYVVQPGDSLAGISYKLYNSANYISKIKELNGIEDENKIIAGQKLIIP